MKNNYSKETWPAQPTTPRQTCRLKTSTLALCLLVACSACRKDGGHIAGTWKEAYGERFSRRVPFSPVVLRLDASGKATYETYSGDWSESSGEVIVKFPEYIHILTDPNADGSTTLRFRYDHDKDQLRATIERQTDKARGEFILVRSNS